MARKPGFSRLGRAGALSVQRRASAYARDPRKLSDLVGRARRKADQQQGVMGELWDELMLLVRMVRAYIDGSYRSIPWQTLVSIVGAVLYFVMPIDLIPDAIAGVGLLDDAAVIAWTVRSIRTDLDRFRAWEQDRQAVPEQQPD